MFKALFSNAVSGLIYAAASAAVNIVVLKIQLFFAKKK
jgi:hypothetical protein